MLVQDLFFAITDDTYLSSALRMFSNQKWLQRAIQAGAIELSWKIWLACGESLQEQFGAGQDWVVSSGLEAIGDLEYDSAQMQK